MSLFLKLSANELSEIERDQNQIFKRKAQQINDAFGLCFQPLERAKVRNKFYEQIGAKTCCCREM